MRVSPIVDEVLKTYLIVKKAANSNGLRIYIKEES
jgi:hypothetical protein